MHTHHSVILADTELWLLPDKAVYWPAQRSLLLADLHFGKAAAYRQLGQPVPHGTTDGNLRRLDTLLERYATDRLLVLGDFLHAPESHTPALLARLTAWRACHAALAISLIRGNHDRRAGDPAAALGIESLDEPLLLGPFALCHEPHPHPTRPVLAGHAHPAFVLRGRARQRLRLPCFSLEARVSLLPAFGEFTGATTISAARGRRIFVVADGRVWPVGAA